MKQKTAGKIVLILLIFSVVVIGGNALLRWWFPSRFGGAAKPQSDEKAGSTAPSREAADELPLEEIRAEDAMLNERQVISWPYDSSVHVFHQPNLQMYRGLARDTAALKGITVVLDISEAEPEAKTSAETESTTAVPTGEGETVDSNATQPPEDPETGESTTEGKPLRPTSAGSLEILRGVRAATKQRLEDLGADVIVVEREGRDDVQQAAQIGKKLLSEFTGELRTQNFVSTRIEQLKPKLEARLDGKAEADPSHPIFPLNGVSADLRLLLDVERQYTDYLYITLKIGDEDAQVGGIRVNYLGNQAAQIGALSYDPDNPQEQPAYIAYNTTARYRLAALLERNFSGLIPDLVNVEEPVREKIMVLPRLTNLTHVEIEIGQKNHPNDIKLLEQEAQRQVVAEAITNACYEFYCTTVLD